MSNMDNKNLGKSKSEMEEKRERRRKREQALQRRRKRRLYIGVIAGMSLVALVLLFVVIKIVAGVVSGGKTEKPQTNTGVEKSSQQVIAADSEADTEAESKEPGETDTPAPAEEPTVQKANDGNIHLVMCGDIVLHSDLERLSARKDGSYDYWDLFKNVQDRIQAADMALINAETIIGGQELKVSGFPRFNASYELADAVAECGFNIILSANNHANDKGVQGIKNTLKNWERFPGLSILGIHNEKSTSKDIYVYEQDGMKIAILNYTSPLNTAMESGKEYMIDRMEETRVRKDIKKAHEMADFVIVCPHWGTECRFYIDNEQKKWAQIFLEEKVDLVLGTHTHVIGKIQNLKDEKSGHEMLCYYALGNFCGYISSTGRLVQNRTIGSMAKVTIGRKDDGSVGILDYGIEALICHISKEQDLATVIPYEYYTEDLAKEHLALKYTGDYSMKFINNLCEENWGDLWKEKK